MGKVQQVDLIRKDRAAERALPEEVSISLQEVAADAKKGSLAPCRGVRLEVLKTVMAEEVSAVVGPKSKHNPDRTAKRHGDECGSIVLGGWRIPVVRPCPRTMNDQEVTHLDVSCLRGSRAG